MPTRSSEDIRLLVAEYVCGLLPANEQPVVHNLLSKDDYALEQALAWEKELLALVDALPPVPPPPALRERLQRTLGIAPPPVTQPPPQPQLLRQPSVPATTAPSPAAHQPGPTAPVEPTVQKSATPPAPAAVKEAAVTTQRPDPASMPADPATEPQPAKVPKATEHPGYGTSAPAQPTSAEITRLTRQLWLWRLIGVSACAAAVVSAMLPGDPPPPPVQVVKVAPTRAAILQAPGTSSTPGWTATLGPEGSLMMRPLVHTEVPVGSQTLLWTRSASLPQARLLGRIDPNQPVQVPAAQLGALADDQILEITLETDEDAAKGQPNGPILFIGQMTVFGSDASGTTREQGSKPAASATGGPIE